MGVMRPRSPAFEADQAIKTFETEISGREIETGFEKTTQDARLVGSAYGRFFRPSVI